MDAITMNRLGEIMKPQEGNPIEVEGVFNPAAIRGKDGQLYLFPRLVGKNNFSRIGIARVLFDKKGDPYGVERIGIALEPTERYEVHEGFGGCEDPRITFLEPVQKYLMTYTALTSKGPRIAFAESDDLLSWKKIGLAKFEEYRGIDFVHVMNKDAAIFPIAVRTHAGKMQMAMLHRPLFKGTRPEETVKEGESRHIDFPHETIWISYCPMPSTEGPVKVGLFNAHHPLATPLYHWELLKIGVGTPPIMTKHGWLIVYHGVSKIEGHHSNRLCYSAGIMILSKEHPRGIHYRSEEPLLHPDYPNEQRGLIADIVFPTAIDCRRDIGKPDSFDVYYGISDYAIGVARLELPEKMPLWQPPEQYTFNF